MKIYGIDHVTMYPTSAIMIHRTHVIIYTEVRLRIWGALQSRKYRLKNYFTTFLPLMI